MLGNGLSRGIKMLGDRVGRHCLQRDQRNDGPPCRVGYGLENISFHDLDEEYATNRLQMQVQPNGFVNSFFTFSKSQKIRSEFSGLVPSSPQACLNEYSFSIMTALA